MLTTDDLSDNLAQASVELFCKAKRCDLMMPGILLLLLQTKLGKQKGNNPKQRESLRTKQEPGEALMTSHGQINMGQLEPLGKLEFMVKTHTMCILRPASACM